MTKQSLQESTSPGTNDRTLGSEDNGSDPDVGQIFSSNVIVTCKINFIAGSWREIASKISSKVTLGIKVRN